MIKQLIEQYPFWVKLIFSSIIFALFNRNMAKRAKTNETNSLIFISSFLLLTILFVFTTYKIPNFNVVYVNILGVIGLKSDFFNFVIIIAILILSMIAIDLKLKLIKLSTKLANIDQKIALDKNAQEYKKRKNTFYRSE